jgi:FAD/FMN-containing dehydrogenase
MDWSKLAAEIEGHVVVPGDPTYNLLRQPFNYRINRQPAAIARVLSEEDVVKCVAFAMKAGVTITSRSGGHGTEGYCSVDGALMIDQSAMQDIRVDTEAKVVHVGAGASWGQVDIATYTRGLAAPGGGCQEVGVAGLTQGGGFGPISRTWGLTIDNLLSARIVTARDQKVIVADSTQNQKLFWALRGGGGGNFGAVTEFTYQLRPIGAALLGGMLLYNWTDTKAVFQFYRDWMNGTNDEKLTLLPMFFFGPGNQPMGGISAFYNGDPDVGLAYIEKILAAANVPDPIVPIQASLNPGTLLAYTGTESTTAWPGTGQYWRSGFLQNDFPDAAIDTFMTEFGKCPLPPNRQPRRALGNSYKQSDLSFGFIESLGGAIADVEPTDTAFFWRDQRFSFTFIGIFDPADATWAAKTKAWADSFRTAMEPYFSGGVYVNYMQADLADWQTAYYGENYAELKAVKATYDPKDVFRFPQDLSH